MATKQKQSALPPIRFRAMPASLAFRYSYQELGVKGNKECFRLGDTKAAKSKGGKSDDDAVKSPAEVLAMLGDSNVPFMTAKSEAVKILGDKTPSTKEEIVVALEELATKPE